MGERNQESATAESVDDMFEPMMGEMSDEDFEDLAPVSNSKRLLAEKRRRAVFHFSRWSIAPWKRSRP